MLNHNAFAFLLSNLFVCVLLLFIHANGMERCTNSSGFCSLPGTVSM